MSRQHVEFKVTGTDKDSGEEDVSAIKPVADGEPGQAAVFKRPSENLRTRTEFLRDEVEALKYLSDADRALLLTSTGTVTWNGVGTGTFSTTADITLKPFLAPHVSTASRLIICAGTVGQITIRTKQTGVAGQPRAYSGANAISIDFTGVTTGTGAIVVTKDGTPDNNVHIQYDNHASSGTTVNQLPGNSFIQQFNASAVAIALGLEAVVEGGGSPAEVGYPAPPASVAGTLLSHPTNGIQAGEMLTRFMSGAADAEKHNITQAHLTAFFAADGGTLNKLIEGDVLCLRYDDLVMGSYGGRRQSIDEFPEDKADSAGANLFLMRRFPARLPGALPLCAVVNGQLVFVNGRSYGSGEVGALSSTGSYLGSGTWYGGVAGIGAGSFESAIDAVVSQLALSTGTSGAARIGATAVTGVAAGSVQSVLQGLSDSIVAGGGDVAAHLADPTDAHDASAISNIPAGTVAATDVQTAINELDTEKARADAPFVLMGAAPAGPPMASILRVDGANATGVAGPFRIKSGAIGTTPFQVQGFTGQTADLQQWLDSVGTSLLSVKNNGALRWTDDNTTLERLSLGILRARAGSMYFDLSTAGLRLEDLADSEVLVLQVDNPTGGILRTNTNVPLTFGTNSVQHWKIHETTGNLSAVGAKSVDLTGGAGDVYFSLGQGVGWPTALTQIVVTTPGYPLWTLQSTSGTRAVFSAASATRGIFDVIADTGSVAARLEANTATSMVYVGAEAVGVGLGFRVNGDPTEKWRITAGGVLESIGGPRLVSSVSDPIAAQDAATKNYVDLRMFPNLCINGGFDFWQRGTSFTVTHAAAVDVFNRKYTSDRWWAGVSDAATPASTNSIVVTRQAYTGPRSTYCLQLALSTVDPAEEGSWRLVQEMDRDFCVKARNETITVRFKARKNVSWTLALQATLTAGTGVSDADRTVDETDTTLPYATVTSLVAQPITLTTAFQTFEFTSTVPVPAGTTAIAFKLSGAINTASLGDTLQIAEVSITIGNKAPKEFWWAAGDLANELVLCQKYFEKSNALASVPGTTAEPYMTGHTPAGSVVLGSPWELGCFPRYLVSKRKSPNIALWSLTGTPANWTVNGNFPSIASSITTSGFLVANNGANPQSVTASVATGGNWTADAEI